MKWDNDLQLYLLSFDYDSSYVTAFQQWLEFKESLMDLFLNKDLFIVQLFLFYILFCITYCILV